MKHALTAIVVAAAVAVGLAAQTPAPAKSSSYTVTLTGCLRQGDTADTFTLANVQWDRGASHTGTGGESAVGTAGSSAGSTKETKSGTAIGSDTVQLTPSGDVDLKSHVGHKIQVTGRLGAAAATSGRTRGDANVPTTTPPDTANPTTSSPPDMNPNTQTSTGQTRMKKGNRTSGAAAGGGPRTVTVTSVKMIAESCGD
jgi:hypothetical protein